MKKLLHTSKYDITKIKASNPDVIHRYVREDNKFVDRVTGMEFPIDGHIELPVSNMRDTQSQMAVTFTLDENVMAGSQYELFRVGTFDEPKVIVLAGRTNNSSITLYYRINRNGSPADVGVTNYPTLVNADRVTILLDPWTMGLVQSRGDGYVTSVAMRKYIRQSASSHSTNDQWNPHDLKGGFTTEFSDIGCNITIVEEFAGVVEARAFGGISGQTPEYLPLCVHTEDDAQRMLLNTYFDNGQLMVGGAGLTHNGTEANGAILLEGVQQAVVAVGNEGRSARFISLPKTGEEAWFIVRNETQEFPVYLGSDGVVTALGRKAAVIQPCAMHFVWVVVVDDGCEVYCDGQPVCRIPINSQGVELVLTSTANRVTGIQLFDCDVRTRSIFHSNAVSNNRPWWVTHTHLVGLGSSWNNGFIYDVHNFYGSDDPKHAEYLGEVAIGGRTNDQLSAGTTRDIKIPFEACAELVGLIIRSRTVANNNYPLTQLRFNLNGEEYEVRLYNIRSYIGIYVFKGTEELESFRIYAVENRASSYNSSMLTSIQVAKGRMRIMFTGICTEVRIPVAKQYSLTNVRFAPYTVSIVNNFVENILGYTAKADTFGMLPHPDTTPTKNLWKQDGRTVFELSGNDLCELVSDTPFDFPVGTWRLGAVNGNHHVITTSSESPCVVPCDVPELSVFTVQILIYEQQAAEEFPSVYDFGDLQIEVCIGAEGRAASVILGDTVIDIPRTSGPTTSVQELLVEADGQTLRVYYAGAEIHSSPFNGTISATNELVISRKDDLMYNSKIGGLRIMNEACALEIMGRGYSAPYSLEVVPSVG